MRVALASGAVGVVLGAAMTYLAMAPQTSESVRGGLPGLLDSTAMGKLLAAPRPDPSIAPGLHLAAAPAQATVHRERQDESKAAALQEAEAADGILRPADLGTELALTPLAPPLDEAGPAPESRRTMRVARGDTLMSVMVKAGAAREEAHAAIAALAELYDPRRLQIGQEITLVFRDLAEGSRLQDVLLQADVDRDVVARRSDDAGGFEAEAVERPLVDRDNSASGRIDDSLYLAAERAGLPTPVLVELIRLYSFDVDFQRDIQPGDRFEVLYESQHTEDGEPARYGDVLYAVLEVRNQRLPLYRFRMADGSVDYFNEQGESVRKALMKTPVDGARLSSRYGMRKHPILGYSRMHRGVDFAAPQGTPVMAAGDGTVELAGRNGGYGKYIRIRHNGSFKTAYAHLYSFAKGIAGGRRVRQGQVIGYVGSTGRSTGPHLHYEVLKDGRQTNPLGLKLPTGKKLAGKELAAFQEIRQALDGRYAEAPQVRSVAQGGPATE